MFPLLYCSKLLLPADEVTCREQNLNKLITSVNLLFIFQWPIRIQSDVIIPNPQYVKKTEKSSKSSK